jgi:hypothetical protein
VSDIRTRLANFLHDAGVPPDDVEDRVSDLLSLHGITIAENESAMNQLGAFNDTIAIAEQQGLPEHAGVVGLAHLRSMYEQAASSNFSESKLGRWLGWAQCAVVAAAIGITLDDMKEINLWNAVVATDNQQENPANAAEADR